jgi:hypothetical protein
VYAGAATLGAWVVVCVWLVAGCVVDELVGVAVVDTPVACVDFEVAAIPANAAQPPAAIASTARET